MPPATPPTSDPASDSGDQQTETQAAPVSNSSADQNPQSSPEFTNDAAEIVAVSNVTAVQPASTRTKQSRAGRLPKFTRSDDLVLAREVAAAKAHVVPNGETKEWFEISASRANATRKLSFSVTWKSVHRYKRLQARFDKGDEQEAMMSGVGGELGEMEELLSSMREVRNDKDKEAMTKIQALEDKEAEKERPGSVMRIQSLNRKATREGTAAKSASGSEEDDERPRKRRCKLGDAPKECFDAELHEFSETLACGNEERNRINQARLQLDLERLEMEKAKRKKDRKERKEEREAASELELRKFRALLELLGKTASRETPQ